MDMSWLIFISFLKHLHKCLCHKSKSSSKYTFIPVHYSLTMEEEAFNFLSLYLYDFYLTAKVRRLYDIANVLSSMNLIEKVIFSSVHFKFPHRALQWKCCFLYSVLINYSKLMMSLRRLQTHTTNTRKPAFRWLGVRGKTWSESAQTNVKESQKRMFGSDITNINFKRKVDLSMDGQNFKTQNQQENISPRAQLEKKSLKKDAKQTSMSYQFGPFAPAYVHKVGTSENNSVKQVQDWESLAQEHRPQYQNQG